MAYTLLKVFHITAMALWLGGMFTFSIIGTIADKENAAALRTLFGRIVTPAMLATWAAGLSLATIGGWFNIATWPLVKITGAFILSGVHGMVAGRLTRRASEEYANECASKEQTSDVSLSIAAPVVTALVMVILIFVATTKPF